jgi:hypothetical protein
LILTTLTLDSWPRQGLTTLRPKREAQKSHHMLPGVQRMWGNEPSHSQMNSHCGSWSPKWTPKYLERDCKGQNPLIRKVLYIIGKLFKHKFLKWVRITHLDIWNTSYDQKKGRELTKFPGVQVACDIPLESSWQGLQLCFTPHCNWRSAHEVMRPKVARVLIGGISRLALGSPWTKNHLDVALVESCRVYYKGEGGGFPQVKAVVSLVSPKLPVARPNTKSVPTMH